ncbi:MAG: helix-turn-helix transcriptional regulator [Verrucomicrobiota bacterium]|jgi:HTH-type transcriptional regulator/antitoxin HipB
MNYIIRTSKQFGPLIKAARQEKGMTQFEAGSQSDLRQNAISLIESNAGRSSVDRLFKLLNALDLEVVIRKRDQI